MQVGMVCPLLAGRLARADSHIFQMSLLEQQRCCVASSSRKVQAVVMIAACMPSALWAAQSMDEVVVAATRTEQPLSDVLADVTIVDRETIERSGALALEDILAKVPGVQITRTGGAGSETQFFLRGAHKQHTAVYIDGIRIDAQNGSGGAPWETLPVDAIERVEVLRGAAGAVYGSDAMAGVVQIFTQRGEAGLQPSVSIGAGRYGTRKASANVRGAQGAWDFALGMSYAESEGFDSKTGGTRRNVDKDGYLRKAANARLGLQIDATHRVDFTALTTDSNAGYDNRVQGNDRSIRNTDAYGLNWESRWSSALSTRISASQSRNVYKTRTATMYSTETVLRNFMLQNEWRSQWGVWSLNLERREDQLENADFAGSGERDRQQNAVALAYGQSWGGHSVQLALRHDRDSDFGSKNTYSAAYGWQFAPMWRATASVGSGFRVPSLYQRFSQSGDASLQPETSRNAELGLRWQNRGDYLGVSVYRNKVDNLVTYSAGLGSCGAAGCYLNVQRAVLEGASVSGALRTGALKWLGSVDFQNPHNAQTGHLLQRRSKRYATLAVETMVKGWTLGAEMQAASRRYNTDTEKKKSLAGYGLLNLAASTQLGKDFTLNMRLDNLADRDYVLAADSSSKGGNYATPGRSFYVGLKWAPQ